MKRFSRFVENFTPEVLKKRPHHHRTEFRRLEGRNTRSRTSHALHARPRVILSSRQSEMLAQLAPTRAVFPVRGARVLQSSRPGAAAENRPTRGFLWFSGAAFQ